MNKLSNQSTLKVYKSGDYEYIYIYYKLNGSLIRLNTKNKVVKNGMTTDLLYNARIPEDKKLNDKTLQIKKLVDNYFRLKVDDFNPKVNQKEFEAILKSKALSNKKSIDALLLYKPKDLKPIEPVVKSKYINQYYQEFYDYKKIELNNRAGLKDYKSLQNALIDYQTYKVKELLL